MTDKIKIEGIPPYDGEYDFDVGYLTNRELHDLKKMTGLRVGELSEALDVGDTDVYVGLAAIALRRNNIDVVESLLWDAEAGSITLIGQEVEADPPPSGSDVGTSEKQLSSGDGSTSASDPPEKPLNATGTQGSPTSATSVLATSAP